MCQSYCFKQWRDHCEQAIWHTSQHMLTDYINNVNTYNLDRKTEEWKSACHMRSNTHIWKLVSVNSVHQSASLNGMISFISACLKVRCSCKVFLINSTWTIAYDHSLAMNLPSYVFFAYNLMTLLLVPRSGYCQKSAMIG